MHPDLPSPHLVQDARGLGRLLAALERASEIAVDTEGDSFFSYPEKVCLIQVTAGEEDWLVDPLAGFDVAPLGDVLEDPARLKVFHDGEYDVLSLKRAYGFAFRNLFDTRVAAATLGSQSPGLASVLEQRFGIQLDKSMQRSNWGERPLSERQVRYARLDTHFLLPLMREQRAELDARGRTMIVEGECRRLERLTPPEAAFDPDGFARIRGARELPPLERQMLRELFVLRERLARASGLPPFRVLQDAALVALAAARPRSPRDLQGIVGFTPRLARKLGGEVLAAVGRAVHLGPLQTWPRLENRDGTSGFSEGEFELHERLKRWRKLAAGRMEVDAAYLVNRHVLLRLAQSRPRSQAELGRIDGIEPWQIEMFGEGILATIARFERDLSSGAVEPRRGRRRPQ